MKWEFGRRSSNVEDRRGMPAGPVVGGGIGAVLLAIVVSLLGGDPSTVLNQAPLTSGNRSTTQAPAPPANDKAADFVSVMLADTEDTWSALFRQMGATYRKPKLVLFSGSVQSACGTGKAAMGPFYCPLDQKVYIDLSFYRDLKYKHNAPGDFAQAYVIAHEVGHHVQNLMGISGKVQNLQRRVSQEQANQLSVMLELQADCLAGVWGHHADRSRTNLRLEPGDVEEALNAASAIGDDRLQMKARGYVVPESFSHGSSAQRVRWFKRGLQTGDINQCNTFEARSL